MTAVRPASQRLFTGLRRLMCPLQIGLVLGATPVMIAAGTNHRERRRVHEHHIELLAELAEESRDATACEKFADCRRNRAGGQKMQGGSDVGAAVRGAKCSKRSSVVLRKRCRPPCRRQ